MNRRVDQKLHLAKLTLATIDSHPSSEKNLLVETALVESALFHLHIAYRAYLHELLLHCNVAISGTTIVETALQAADMLRMQQLQSGDIDELVKMERSGAWPAQLCAAYANAASYEMKKETAAIANVDIALHDVTARVDGDVLIEWMRQFQLVIQRQREHAQEW